MAKEKNDFWQEKMSDAIMTIMAGMKNVVKEHPDSFKTVAYALSVVAYEVDKVYPVEEE